MKTNLFILSLLLLFGVAACSDDDLVNETEDTWTEKDEALALDSLRYEMLIQQLCFEEKQANGTVAYTSRHGKALYAAAPTTYYVGVDTFPQARETWQSIISAAQDSISAQTQTNEINVLNLHLTYTESDDEGELARIDVDCPELESVLTSIVFIPMTQWPNNDKGSPFGFLSVWKENKTGYYYLCVRKAFGSQGILLTFDGGWEEDWFRKYDHWQGQFYLWKNTAGTDVFDALSGCMRWNETKVKQAMESLSKAAGTTNKTYAQLSRIYQLSQQKIYSVQWWISFFSSTFDNGYTYSHHIWWAYNCYDVTITRSRFSSNLTCSHWSSSYTHKETPGRYNPSHAIYFDPDYNNKTGWTCILKGT